MRCSRGQMFSQDSIFAVILISFLLVSLVFMATEIADAIAITEGSSEISEATHYAANQLLWTAGSPRNWEENATWYNEVSSVGLALEKNVLSARKVEAFFNSTQNRSLAYNITKNLLGLSRSGLKGSYEFNVAITDVNGETLYDTRGLPTDQLETVSVERLALLNGSIVRVRMDVWVE